MEQQPPPSPKPIRSRPIWQAQLDRVEGRLDDITTAVERLDARISELSGGLADEGSDGPASVQTAAAVLHELEMVSSRIADQALDGAVSREVLQRLEGTLSGYSETVSRLAEGVESVRSMVEGLRTTSVANEVAISGLSGAVDDLGERLTSTQKRMIARSHLDEVRNRIEQAEVALAHQANVIGNALRARIDDQRAMSDELGAQVTNLNANIAWTADSPDQLRREVRQTIESLASRVGVAMREVRSELAQTSSSRELTTGVDAGMARLSDRLRTDADRLAKVVSNVHADNDERLRRISLQMSEMQRTIELLRWGQRVDQELADTEAKLGPIGPLDEEQAPVDEPADDAEFAAAPSREPELHWSERGQSLPVVVDGDHYLDDDDHVLRAEVVDPEDWSDDPDSGSWPNSFFDQQSDLVAAGAADVPGEDHAVAYDVAAETDAYDFGVEDPPTDVERGETAAPFYDAVDDDDFPVVDDDDFSAVEENSEEFAPVYPEAQADERGIDWGAFAPDEGALEQVRWPRRR